MFNIKNIIKTCLLTEGLDIDKTWKNFGEKISHKLYDEDIMDNHKEAFHEHLKNADPTEHKEYAPWIAAKYANGGINRLEDFGRTNQALTSFHKAKIKKQLVDSNTWGSSVKADNIAHAQAGNENPIPFTTHLANHGVPNDLGKFPSLTHLEDAVDTLPKEEEGHMSEKETKESGATKYDGEHWTTIVPHTKEASCIYGRGTRWCTAATGSYNYFDSYNKQGPMHIMIPKKPEHPGEAYQFHLGSGSFMDEKDVPVSMNILGKRPNQIVSKHIEDHITTAPVSMRAGLAASGTDTQREKLLSDPTWEVQHAIALNGNATHKKIAGDWVDKNFDKAPTSARKEVARFGPAHLQDKLVNDSDEEVQSILAKHGNENHKDALLKNPNLSNKIIKSMLESENNGKYLEHFKTHQAPVVRSMVAKQGSPELRKQMYTSETSMLAKSAIKEEMTKRGEI